MKKLYSVLSIFLVMMMFASESALAQRSIGQYRGTINTFKKNKRYFSVGGSINALNYFGDLAPKNRIASTDISFTRPGIALTAQYRLGPQASVRGSFMWGRLRGDDATSDLSGDAADRHIRNLHFRNDIKELSAQFVWDFKRNERTFISRPQLVPYVFAGLAVLHHNPKAQVPERDYVHFDINDGRSIADNSNQYGASPGDWVALKPLQTEGKNYSNFAFAIPVGAGIRYRLDRYWDLSFEISYRQTFTDYLDDVSSNYRNPEDFGTGPEANLARVMAYRSNELRNFDAIEESGRFLISSPWANPLNPGQDYVRYPGYGVNDPNDVRGKDDYDVYLVTSIQVTYIIGTNIRNAKFR